jgi:predicted nuclease of restriction endonuclease-like (RecB) superfamily
MRTFARAWPKREIVQEALAQLSWYQNLVLLEKLKSTEQRLWYATKAYEYGWSRNILAMQIEMQAHFYAL